MFPGLGGMNPKKMQGMMKQLGIQQDDIPAEKVTIEKTDGSKIVIEEPQVQKITMQGQTSYQITGESKEESAEKFTKDDIKLVAEKTSKSEEEAKKALEETNGDIAEAIMKLSE
ncbi:MAG: nascent polypeptide-associated complex protein [archaeon]